MHGVCEKCTVELPADYWACGGFCSGRFCFKCTGMSSEIQHAVNSNACLHWMCNACTGLMAKARFTKAVHSVNAAYEGIIETIKTEIRDNILSEIRSEIRNNLKQIPEIVANTPIRNLPTRIPLMRSSAKRPRVNDENDGISAPPRKLICGTGGQNSDTCGITIDTASSDAKLFWIYLSGIDPRAPDEKVIEMVKTRLATDDVKLVKLVPRGRDVSSLTYVSFKLGVCHDLKPKAMTSSTWPMGIRFREFENYSSNKLGFWDPVVDQPQPDTPSTTN